MHSNYFKDRFLEIAQYKEEIKSISKSMLLKLEHCISNATIDGITCSNFRVVEKMFLISSRRKSAACDEIRNILSYLCDSLIIAREKKLDFSVLKKQLYNVIKKEKLIFNNKEVKRKFLNTNCLHPMYEQCKSNKMNLIASQALLLFEDEKFMFYMNELFEKSSYALLDEFILDEKDFFYPPLFGDPNNCFANNYLTASVFFLICLNYCLASNGCCDRFFEKMNCKMIKIEENLFKKYKLKNHEISYLDFSILFSKMQLLKQDVPNINLEIKDSIFFIKDTKCDWLIIPNSGYIFGGQQNNNHLNNIVGGFRTTLFYGQDCVSSVSGLLKLDYENCDTQNISFFQMLVLEFFISKYGEDKILDGQTIQIADVIGDLEYFISSIECRNGNILEKIIKKNKKIASVINRKIFSEFGSPQYYNEINKIFKLESIRVLAKKAKAINYSSISKTKEICNFIKNKVKNSDLMILISNLDKQFLFENYAPYFEDQVSGHFGCVVDCIDNDNILFLGVARSMENEKILEVNKKDFAYYSKGADGLCYQIKSLKKIKFSSFRLSVIQF